MSSVSTAINYKVVPPSYTLTSFSVVVIRVIPSVCACVDIMISASNGEIYNRSFDLSGQAYLEWTNDEYIYNYVRTNIKNIFENIHITQNKPVALEELGGFEQNKKDVPV